MSGGVQHIPAPPPSRPPTSAGEQVVVTALPIASMMMPQSQQEGGNSTSAAAMAALPTTTVQRASSARKKAFSSDQSMFRPSTPQHRSVLMPHKRIFQERNSEEIFSARSRGEQLRLLDQLRLSHKIGTFGSASGVVDEWAQIEAPATTLSFLKPTGWRPSGGKEAPIVDVLLVEEQKKRAAAAAKKKSKEGSGQEEEDEPEEPPAPPVDTQKLTYRLAEEDLVKREKMKQKRLDKLLKATEASGVPTINHLDNDPPPKAPDGGARITKKLVEDVERRNKATANSLHKALTKQDDENRNALNRIPRKTPYELKPIEDMNAFVDRMYAQQKERKENKRRMLQAKYCKPPPSRKLSTEEQKKHSARLYIEGTEKTSATMEKAHRKYVVSRQSKFSQLSDAQRSEACSRLHQKTTTTSGLK